MAKKKCPIFDHYPMFLPHFLSQKKEIKNGFRFCFFIMAIFLQIID